MSKEQVEQAEQEKFENFLDKIYDEYKHSELSYFERNLEVIINLSLYNSSNQSWWLDNTKHRAVHHHVWWIHLVKIENPNSWIFAKLN